MLSHLRWGRTIHRDPFDICAPATHIDINHIVDHIHPRYKEAQYSTPSPTSPSTSLLHQDLPSTSRPSSPSKPGSRRRLVLILRLEQILSYVSVILCCGRRYLVLFRIEEGGSSHDLGALTSPPGLTGAQRVRGVKTMAGHQSHGIISSRLGGEDIACRLPPSYDQAS